MGLIACNIFHSPHPLMESRKNIPVDSEEPDMAERISGIVFYVSESTMLTKCYLRCDTDGAERNEKSKWSDFPAIFTNLSRGNENFVH